MQKEVVITPFSSLSLIKIFCELSFDFLFEAAANKNPFSPSGIDEVSAFTKKKRFLDKLIQSSRRYGLKKEKALQQEDYDKAATIREKQVEKNKEILLFIQEELCIENLNIKVSFPKTPPLPYPPNA